MNELPPERRDIAARLLAPWRHQSEPAKPTDRLDAARRLTSSAILVLLQLLVVATAASFAAERTDDAAATFVVAVLIYLGAAFAASIDR